MINFDSVTREIRNEQNPNWPQIPDESQRILVFGGSGFGKHIHCFIY